MLKRVIDCPYFKREIEYERCIKCKYCRPYGEDMIYCVAEDSMVEIKYRR